MDIKDLDKLKGLVSEASQDLRKLEEAMSRFTKKEAQILELLSDDLDYPRSYERDVKDLQEMSRRVKSHTFLRRVARLLPDLERSSREDERVSEVVRDDLKDALVQVGDVRMTLGELLRSLEQEE
jgi:uncharacterized membrane protein YgaE (UPF0421/DUF939 family)